MSPVENPLGTMQLPDCHGRPTCDPRPVCPSCGGLECLCRPRFFAGQLLTDEDLNRLDHYMQAKNRLHNRFLHGWGVACGLEVVCGVCGPDHGHVVVKPGYALSPCGNDIVVCKTESVDVCDLISRCRPPADDCHDLFAQPAADIHNVLGVAAGVGGHPVPECSGTEEWVLAICYTEKPSRGLAALRAQPPEPGCGCGGSSPAGSGCGCGGKGKHSHGSGGCGCGSGAKRKPPVAASRSIPEQCEPTVTCEGYRFVMYQLPRPERAERDYSAAERRFLCCIAPLIRHLDDPNGMPAEQRREWVVAFRNAVRDFLLNEGLYDCEIAEKLAFVVIPSAAGKPADTLTNELAQAALSLTRIAALAIQKCYCAALLPPCPEPSQNDCVPLATITVTPDRCRVKRICNVGARKFLLTPPNVEYWLTFIMESNPLSEYLESLCCRFDPADWEQEGIDFFKEAGGRMREQVKGRKKKSGTAKETVEDRRIATRQALFWQSVSTPKRRFTFEHLLLGTLGARNRKGEPIASDDELANSMQAVLFSHVLAPLVRTILPERLQDTAAGGDLTDVARQLAELQATVKTQQSTIDKQDRVIKKIQRDR